MAGRYDGAEDLRAAQLALVRAGYPHLEAWQVLVGYLHRVRSARTSLPQAAAAGVITGLVLGLGALFLLFGGVLAVGLLIAYCGMGGQPGVGADAGTASGASQSPFGLLRVALTAATLVAPLVGLAGAGLAIIERQRWRDAGSDRTFVDQLPGARHLLFEALLWVLAGGVIVAAAAWWGGESAGRNVLQLAGLVGIPIAAAFFGAGFRNLYPQVLPRIGRANTAAFARPVVEREAAIQIDADRAFYGRRAFERDSFDASLWADEVLQRHNVTESERARASAKRLSRRSGASASKHRQRTIRTIVITVLGALSFELLARWIAWFNDATPFTPFANHPIIDIIGLGLGIPIGLGCAYLYDRYVAG